MGVLELEKRAQELRELARMSVSFPLWVSSPTKCTWKTNSLIKRTPHGVERITIRSLVG